MSHSKSVSKNHTRAHHSGEEGGLSSMLLHSGIGALTALGASALLILLGGAICAASEDPLSRILPISLITLYLSSLIGGLVTRKLHGKASLLSGLCCGILLAVFFLLLSLFFPDSQTFSFPLALFLRSMILVFSILGGYLGSPRAKKTSPRRR